ncbi:hypothetical protein [Streptomyces sp. NPDC051219]|uniref:hypothetical protein n=1 Tax=Streptomyces sp. NPDC051219 TaxID=3155283 RepID=UPI003433ACEE
MRGTRVAAAATLLGAAALCLGATAVTAEAMGTAEDGSDVPSFGYTASPTVVAAGGTVTLGATGCAEPAVTVSSAAFGDVTLRAGRPGTVKIDPAAEPGTEYDVTFDCMGQKGMATLAIADGPGTPTGTHGGAEADTEADTDTDTEADTDTDTDTETDTETGSHTGDDGDTEARTEDGTDPGEGRYPEGDARVRHGVKGGAGGSLTGIAPVPTAAGAALIAGAAGAGVYLARRHHRG